MPLRLRVKDVDLNRLQVVVRAGKGDKDRVTMLPESLVEPLRAHRDRLRGLHEQDRAAGLAGVWLPEAPARKYPGAGVSWEWFWFFPSRQISLDPHADVERHEPPGPGPAKPVGPTASLGRGPNPYEPGSSSFCPHRFATYFELSPQPHPGVPLVTPPL